MITRRNAIVATIGAVPTAKATPPTLRMIDWPSNPADAARIESLRFVRLPTVLVIKRLPPSVENKKGPAGRERDVRESLD